MFELETQYASFHKLKDSITVKWIDTTCDSLLRRKNVPIMITNKPKRMKNLKEKKMAYRINAMASC